MQWRRLLSAVLGLVLALGVATTALEQVSSPPVVASVNGARGDVLVPTVDRQVSPALDITSGSVSWTFPKPFVGTPTCGETIAQADGNYVFSAPVTTAISTASVTISVRTALQILNILKIGALTIWSMPPPGTTVTLSCIGGASP